MKKQQKTKPLFEHGKDGQRVFIVGQSGSGKSHHARQLISDSNIHFLIIDLKDDAKEMAKAFFKLGERVAITANENTAIKMLKEYSVVIYSPSDDFDESDIDNLIRLFYCNVRNAGLCFDEAYLLPASKWLKILLTRGRSKGLSVISCSQRPVVVPSVCKSEAKYFFIHRLTLPIDTLEMKKLTGHSHDAIKAIEGYGFLTYES